MRFDKVEKYRVQHPFLGRQKVGDDFGWFEIKRIGNKTLSVLAAPSDEEWQHVSVSVNGRCPTWEEMCFVKDLFWDENETVVQFHPPKSDYVNNHKYCLHLWRYRGQFPRPPMHLIGLKDLGELS